MALASSKWLCQSPCQCQAIIIREVGLLYMQLSIAMTVSMFLIGHKLCYCSPCNVSNRHVHEFRSFFFFLHYPSIITYSIRHCKLQILPKKVSKLLFYILNHLNYFSKLFNSSFYKLSAFVDIVLQCNKFKRLVSSLSELTEATSYLAISVWRGITESYHFCLCKFVTSVDWYKDHGYRLFVPILYSDIIFSNSLSFFSLVVKQQDQVDFICYVFSSSKQLIWSHD